MALLKDLVGETLVKAENAGNYTLIFETQKGEVYQMLHEQDCCEDVSIDDITGDLSDLVGTPILQAKEYVNNNMKAKGEYDDSFTWTFYTIATIKGYVDIRWYGTSNGYYSESVSVVKKGDYGFDSSL